MPAKFLNKKYFYLFLILALAFFLRIIFLGSQSMYFDENGYLIVARLYNEKPISLWSAADGQPPPFGMYLDSVFFRFLGANEFALRFVSVIFGLLTVFLVYKICRLWYSKRTSLLAALLLAILPLHVVFSRLGFIDILLAFIILLSIFVLELSKYKKLKRKKEFLYLALGGALFGLAFVTKYSALTIWGLYWLFSFVEILFGKNKKEMKLNIKNLFYKFVFANFIAFIFILLSTGFRPSNIFYLVYSFAYLSIVQTFSQYAPFYYPLLLLMEGLSPLMFLIFIISIMYLIKIFIKTRNQNDAKLLFIALFFILSLLIQRRSGSRHLVILMPFVAIILARFFMEFVGRIKPKNAEDIAIFSVVFILVSTCLYSFYQINELKKFDVWKDVGNFVNTNSNKDITVHSIYPYWPLGTIVSSKDTYSYYFERNVSLYPKIELLNSDDYVIFGDFSANYTISVEQEPFRGTISFFGIILYQRNRIEPYPKFQDFVMKNGKNIRTFYCNDKPCIWIYEMNTVTEQMRKDYGENEAWDIYGSTKKNDFFGYMCKKIKKEFFYYITINYFPKNLQDTINKKCNSLVS